MSIDEINDQIKQVDSSKISDGYHTFGELYEHRIFLWIAFCKLISKVEDQHRDTYAINRYHPERTVWRTKRHSDGELAFGGDWFVLGYARQPGEQITYHLPMEYWEVCAFAQTLDKAPDFDGHTSDDVLARLMSLPK